MTKPPLFPEPERVCEDWRMKRADAVIIGGGIVGLATAWQLIRRHPERTIAVIEKESTEGQHQSGHNSGVLHTGIYYVPGSLKARNCTEGKRLMEEFCAAEGITFERCGKIIVAVTEGELPALERVFERGTANGVRCELIGPEQMREIEPHVAGIKAIHVPDAGIVDYRGVCRRLREKIEGAGHEVLMGARLIGSHPASSGRVVETTAGEREGRVIVNCAGLHSDRVATILGYPPGLRIVPFRGEYYSLKPEAEHLCRNLIYPVPDPAFPFLGVHYTRMATGGVECGPNAVLALAREGYRWRNISVRDLAETLTFPGFLRFAGRHWQTGLMEMWRSVSRAAFTRSLQRLIPAVEERHLEPAPAGVRAQAMLAEGKLVDDFAIEAHPGVVNVLNAPSPAATSSLSIGAHIVSVIEQQL